MPEDAAGGDVLAAGGDVLVAVAHGSEDPRAAATIEELMSLVRARAVRAGAGLDVRTAYLGHNAPSLPQVLGSIDGDRRTTVLPLLLTSAYHSKTDIPRILARFAPDVSYAATLGPHPLLLTALGRRLAEAAGTPGAGGSGASARPDERASERAETAVVLAAAGSSDPDANATVARLAAQWQAAAGWRTVTPAYASAASPATGEAVAELLRAGASRVVVATYLLASGYFADRIRDEALAAGAAAVSQALGASPELADIVLERHAMARSAHRTAA
jgi:sirohydrochlorin ferrochelatase